MTKRKVPPPLQIAAFFGMAVVFATWQPFVWWRAVGSVIMLALGCYGVYVLLRSRWGTGAGDVDGGTE
jgi:hypothetical protein